MQVERRGEPSCPAREEREKEREAVERWIFTRRKSGHALKTMTVGNISSPLTLITGLWLPLLRLPSLPALPATLLFSLRGGVSSLPPVFARLSNPRPRGCLRRYLKLKYMVVQPSRVNFEGARWGEGLVIFLCLKIVSSFRFSSFFLSFFLFFSLSSPCTREGTRVEMILFVVSRRLESFSCLIRNDRERERLVGSSLDRIRKTGLLGNA